MSLPATRLKCFKQPDDKLTAHMGLPRSNFGKFGYLADGIADVNFGCHFMSAFTICKNDCHPHTFWFDYRAYKWQVINI